MLRTFNSLSCIDSSGGMMMLCSHTYFHGLKSVFLLSMFLPALGMPVLLPDGVVALRHGNGREPDSGTGAVMRKHDKLVTTSPEHQKSVTCSVFLCLLSPLYTPLWTVLKWAYVCGSAEVGTIPASTSLELYVHPRRTMHLT